MATIRLDVKSTLSGVEIINTFHYWNAAVVSNSTIIGELITDFVADVIEGLWREFLPSQYVFTEVKGSALDFPFPVITPISVAGTVTTPDTNILPPYMALIVKLGVSGNFDPITGTPTIPARPVRGGRKYFSGLTEVFQELSGYVNPGGTDGADLDAFLAALNDDRTGGGYDWEPVVLGNPIEGTRQFHIVAPITSAAAVRFTKLGSRLQ